MREKATQAQLAAISPQPLALSYAAKHGTPALIKHSLEISTGRNNYSLTQTLMACVWTSWCLLWVHVWLFVYAACTIQHFLSTITVGRRCSSFNHFLIHTPRLFYIVIDFINSQCCLMQLLNLFGVMNPYLGFVCMQHTPCSWWITPLSFGLFSWKELPEVILQH